MTSPLVISARFPATMDGASDASSWLRRIAADEALEDKLAFAMEVCLEELATNVVRHGRTAAGRSEPLSLHLALRLWADTAELEIEDNGQPFDVSRAPGVPIGRPLVEVSSGGLGVRLIRSFSEELLYEPLPDGNRVIVRFLRERQGATKASA